MVPEGEERVRAILWMIADADPGMPVLSALGHLRAVEQVLAEQERVAASVKDAGGGGARRYGLKDGAALARDVSSSTVITVLARKGRKADIVELLVKHTDCAKGAAQDAAETLVNTMGDGGAW